MHKLFMKIIIAMKHLLRKDANDAQIKLYRISGYTIGERCRIFSKLTAAEPYLVKIGDNVTISTDVKILTHDNSIIKVSSGKFTDLFGRVTIGNNVFIGAGAIILPGVSIGNNTIVAAGSVVTKSVDIEGTIIGGNPASIIGDWETYRKKNNDFAFNAKGKNREERKNMILANADKIIGKAVMKKEERKK